jgi:hypothetical protein
MKNTIFARLKGTVITGAAIATVLTGSLLTSCSKEEVVAPQEKAPKIKGLQNARVKLGPGQYTDKGYFATLWSANLSGSSADISFPQSGTYPGNFQITYSKAAIVGGKGWATGSDTRKINFNVGYLSAASTWNTVGVYGWVQNPLIEYYVNEAGVTPFNFGTWATLGSVWVDSVSISSAVTYKRKNLLLKVNLLHSGSILTTSKLTEHSAVTNS